MFCYQVNEHYENLTSHFWGAKWTTLAQMLSRIANLTHHFTNILHRLKKQYRTDPIILHKVIISCPVQFPSSLVFNRFQHSVAAPWQGSRTLTEVTPATWFCNVKFMGWGMFSFFLPSHCLVKQLRWSHSPWNTFYDQVQLFMISTSNGKKGSLHKDILSHPHILHVSIAHLGTAINWI